MEIREECGETREAVENLEESLREQVEEVEERLAERGPGGRHSQMSESAMTSPWAAETVASSADTTGTTTTGRRWSNINNSQLVRRKEPSPQGGVSSSRSSPSSPSIAEEDAEMVRRS